MRRTLFQRLVSWLVNLAYGEALRAQDKGMLERLLSQPQGATARHFNGMMRAGFGIACDTIGADIDRRGAR